MRERSITRRSRFGAQNDAPRAWSPRETTPAPDGTATGGSDFDRLVGCRRVEAGTTSVTFTVTVRGDRRREADERMYLVAGGDLRFRYTRALATGTIRNDG
ncbi:hypothetical protein ACNTMW_21635 [Planosporangium sp. 12N6]|uniref:hypothetical protein n=1 Tax=Planosporangium spinosum TaxID=3402278 RepID=UPI003CF04F63